MHRPEQWLVQPLLDSSRRRQLHSLAIRDLLMAVDKNLESALLRRRLCDLLMVVHAAILTTLLLESKS
jgi:hypothetical protein